MVARKYTDEEIVEIRKLRRQGMKLKDIADRFGNRTCTATISYICRAAWYKTVPGAVVDAEAKAIANANISEARRSRTRQPNFRHGKYAKLKAAE